MACAKFEVTSAESDLGNEQQREKREERREKQEESDQPDEDERVDMAMVRCQKGGMAKKRVSPFVLFFHRRAAPARFAAIPTWRRRWAVGALGARPDAYTLRRINEVF